MHPCAMLQSCASLPCRYPRHHSTFPSPSQVMCFTSRHVSLSFSPRNPTCLFARAGFPSARNAHQRTVGALLSKVPTYIGIVSPCSAAVLRLRETQFRMPAGRLVFLSLTSHWTTYVSIRSPAKVHRAASRAVDVLSASRLISISPKHHTHVASLSVS